MEIVIRLHSHKFPFMAHPFQRVIVNAKNQITGNELRGISTGSSIITDGEILQLNFPNISNGKLILSEVSKQLVYNLTSDNSSKVQKSDAIINGFVPFIYTEEAEKGKYNVNILAYENRLIHWGIYELKNDNDFSVWADSYAISSIVYPFNGDYSTQIYQGALSDSVMGGMNMGVVISFDIDKKLAVRGLNTKTLFSENFNKKTSSFHENILSEDIKTYSDEALEMILGNISPISKMTNPPISFKTKKQLAEPISIIEKEQKKGIVTKKVVKIHKKDSRIYLTDEKAKKTFGKLISIFNKYFL